MSKVTKNIALVGLICLLMGFAAGCSKDNAVKLTYALGDTRVPCAGDVVIFKFDDNRANTNLGKNSDGQPITSLSDVADWVGWALFDELTAAGCNPKYRTSTVAPEANVVITGEVLEVSLNPTGTTTYAGKVSVKIMVQKEGKTIHSEKFTSEVEDVAITGYGSRSDILAEALRGLLAEVVPTITGKM